MNYNNDDDSGGNDTHQVEGRCGHSRQREKYALRPSEKAQALFKKCILQFKAFQIPKYFHDSLDGKMNKYLAL